MSLFEKDTFYSTSRSSRTRLQIEEPSPFTKGRNIRMGSTGIMVTLSAIGGAMVMLLLVVLVFGVGGGADTQQAGAINSVISANAGASDDVDPAVKALDKVSEAVVSVLTLKKSEKGDEKPAGMGSGVVFKKEGGRALIITNNHVVEEGTSFEILTEAGTKKSARLIGKDRISDLAVLETDASGISQVAEFGDSRKLKRGEPVLTIGNPLGLSTSVTRGIISSPRQTVPVSLSGDGDIDWEMDMIQTDAAINEGNSGGALVDMQGRLIGINTLKIANITVEGMGFAIPIDDAIPILQDLITQQKVKRPLIGVTMQNLQSFKGTEVLKLPSDVKTGVIVLDASGPAKAAGMSSQDVITSIDGRDVGSILELRKYLYKQKKIGDKLEISYYRGGKKQTASIVLGESES